MTSICVQCLKPFTGRNATQEFCTPVCRAEFKKAERVAYRRRREIAREANASTLGTRGVQGGRQAINFRLQDGSEIDR